MSTYLIVADRSAWSMGLARSISPMCREQNDAEFVVVVPADPSYQADEGAAMHEAQEAAARASTSLRLEGLRVIDALAGCSPPRKALEQAMASGTFDGIIVGASRRNAALQIQPDLVRQLERRHGVPVRLINLQSTLIAHHQ